MCTDWTSVYTLMRESLGGSGVRNHVNSNRKILSTGRAEESRTRDTASRRTVSPAHYQLSCSGPAILYDSNTVFRYTVSYYIVLQTGGGRPTSAVDGVSVCTQHSSGDQCVYCAILNDNYPAFCSIVLYCTVLQTGGGRPTSAVGGVSGCPQHSSGDHAGQHAQRGQHRG